MSLVEEGWGAGGEVINELNSRGVQVLWVKKSQIPFEGKLLILA